jgi:hypothetical protein
MQVSCSQMIILISGMTLCGDLLRVLHIGRNRGVLNISILRHDKERVNEGSR